MLVYCPGLGFSGLLWMRKLFKKHHVYTFIVGMVGFVWVFGRPPLDLPASIDLAQTSRAVKPAAVRQDLQPKPVEPVSIGSIIAQQNLSEPVAEQRTVGLEPGDITATLTKLPSSGAAEALGKVLRVAAENLRMRAGPSSQSSTLGAYPLGTQVELLTRSGQWLEVRNLSDGSIGWMFAEYLAEVE